MKKEFTAMLVAAVEKVEVVDITGDGTYIRSFGSLPTIYRFECEVGI